MRTRLSMHRRWCSKPRTCSPETPIFITSPANSKSRLPDSAAEEHPPDDVYRDHVGIHAQKQPGLSYVGAVALRGRINADQMQAAADLAERFAGGELRATNMQNMLVVNVPTLNAEPLAKE